MSFTPTHFSEVWTNIHKLEYNNTADTCIKHWYCLSTFHSVSKKKTDPAVKHIA